jgi:hypothetical protein
MTMGDARIKARRWYRTKGSVQVPAEWLYLRGRADDDMPHYFRATDDRGMKFLVSTEALDASTETTANPWEATKRTFRDPATGFIVEGR